MRSVVAPLRVVRHSAANAVADLRATYTWTSWTVGWLGRMLAQVTFFASVGLLLGSPEHTRFLVIGNSVMTCVIEAMMVVASSTWERRAGTLPLLLAAPTQLGWVFFGRSLQWPVSGSATSLVSLFALAPLFGVSWTAGQVLLLLVLVPLAALSAYCFGLFLAALVLNAAGLRNIVSNASYLVMMAICGVQIPVTFWPGWVQDLATALPLTHVLAAVRRVAEGAGAEAVLPRAALGVAVGCCWFAAALLAFRLLAERARRGGGSDFS
ncbi:ABC transporter permease [Crossiella cryophila]|uniref:ABC-2 type transport system permease protein n=1 Tax=Crossiella cryophila TaxID=43355 RepID=A0A7W7FXC5_9PSEU|nr:ABC transporter permease [Crossiella cryophila]MBB4678774.1 ABC-2 type transport system permease protein [Crossiella cryophila]